VGQEQEVVGRDGSHYPNVWFDILTPVSAEIGAT